MTNASYIPNPPVATTRPDRPEWLASKAAGDAGEQLAARVFKRLGLRTTQLFGRNSHDLDVAGSAEVKFDRIAWSSGNCAIEISYKGGDSGIFATSATSWVIVIQDPRDDSAEVIVVNTFDLRDLVDEYRHRAVRAGEGAVCVLVPTAAMKAKGSTWRMAA